MRGGFIINDSFTSNLPTEKNQIYINQFLLNNTLHYNNNTYVGYKWCESVRASVWSFRL